MITGSGSTEIGGCDGLGRKEIMLFGVRVVVDPMRKSVSLNNLSQYEQADEILKKTAATEKNDGEAEVKGIDDATLLVAAGGYVSADDAVPIASSVCANRERKRGIPWNEEEHKRFLLGLRKVGKGDWKGISKNFVKTRTPTQVASHAQKYFLRRSNLNRRRRRSSLFDITTETVSGMLMEQGQVYKQDDPSPSPPPQSEPSSFGRCQVNQVLPAPLPPHPVENLILGHVSPLSNTSSNLVHLVPASIQPQTLSCLNLDLNSSANLSLMSLDVSLASSTVNGPSSRHSAFQATPILSQGDRKSVMSVA